MAERTYADLEGDDEQQLSLLPVKKLKKRIKQIKKRLRREQEERRIREVALKAVQDELWDRALVPVVRKKADQPRDVPQASKKYPEPVEFEERLRAGIKLFCDPEQLDKLTNVRLAHEMGIEPNTLWGYLKRYGYVHEGETLARCLNRLADEWHPEWRASKRSKRSVV